METGIVGLPAPDLEHVRWIDEDGEPRDPLTLDELGPGFKVLYFFQDWCSGCHRHGFPTLVTLVNELRDKRVGFAAIQTVFEGSDINTFDRVRESQRRYGLRIPFGHAAADTGAIGAVPAIMEAYRAGGTPWFVVIAPDGRVVYDARVKSGFSTPLRSSSISLRRLGSFWARLRIDQSCFPGCCSLPLASAHSPARPCISSSLHAKASITR